MPPITGLTYVPDLEYEIKENEFITNPAETWEFAKPVTVLFPHSLRGVVNAIWQVEGKQQRVKALGTRIHTVAVGAVYFDSYLAHNFL